MALTTEDRLLVEQRVTNDGKNLVVAYLFWFFLWWLSAHRFYLGRWQTALMQIASYFILVGFVWIVIDLFLIPGMTKRENDKLRAELSAELDAERDLDF